MLGGETANSVSCMVRIVHWCESYTGVWSNLAAKGLSSTPWARALAGSSDPEALQYFKLCVFAGQESDFILDLVNALLALKHSKLLVPVLAKTLGAVAQLSHQRVVHNNQNIN